MWKEPPYFREILDPETPGVDRYIALVSSPDSGKDTEVHHIVPVAYFKDVLGRTDCRMAGAPDMNPVNLVPLSKGRHVLAHFYLAKYAKKCIAVQMRNAFCQTYQTTDFSKVTEEEVLSRIDEINAEYRKLKNSKKEHKDGVEIRRTKSCVSQNTWKDGKPTGISMKWYPDGSIRYIHNHEWRFTIEKKTYKQYPGYNDYQIYGAFEHGGTMEKYAVFNKVLLRMEEFTDGRDGVTFTIHVGDKDVVVQYNTSIRNYEWFKNHEYVRFDKYEQRWDAFLKYLGQEENSVIAKGIRSLRKYIDMLGAKLIGRAAHLLDTLESIVGEGESYPAFDVPDFPVVDNGKNNFDRVSPSYRKLTQVRDGKSVATYWWDERGKITGICQDGLPHIFYEKRHIQLNGLHDGAISNDSHDIRLEVPEPWFYMSDEERLDFIKSRYPVFNSLNPIPPIPERILATLAKAA